ncbi:MAG: hypothetical protein ACTHJH_03635 [Marmoricola sp.]
MPYDIRRGAALAALVLTLGSASAGCGDNTSAAGEQAPSSSSAVQATPALTKATFAGTMTEAIQSKRSAHLQVKVGTAMRAVGDVAYDGSVPTMQMALTFSGQQAELRFVHGTAYLSVPGLTPQGKYLSVTPDDAMMGSLVQQLKGFGPQGALGMLKGAVTSFRDAGTTTIVGEQVRHYVVTVDPSRLLQQMKLPMGVPKSAMPRHVTEDLYVGAGNLMRRVVMDAAGQRITIDTTKWGEPVHVTAPPASDVVKSPGGLGGGLFSDSTPAA